MRQSTFFAALSALTSVAVAQSSNFTVDPATIDTTTKTEWCQAQFNSCNLLCGGSAPDNDCVPSTLKFSCKCANGTAPGLDYYLQTLPTLLCEQSFKDCIAKNTGDSIAQGKCTKDIKSKCGTLDPTKADTSGSSGGSASTTAAAPSGTGATTTTGGTAPASSTSKAAAATQAVHILGNGVAMAAAGLLAALL